jgi:hypothetical protein
MKHIIFGALIAGALSAISFVSPASAQATRTWVSGVGDDANPCSRTAPCKTFAGAISKTATAGEINCLDPGGFGTLTITKSIAVVCTGTLGSVLASGVPGMTVNGAGAVVILDGLELDGVVGSTVAAGTTGLNIIQATRVIVKNTTIRRFANAGISLASTNNTALTVSDSNILLNGGGGISIAPAAGSANFALIVRSVIDSNTGFAVQINNASSNVAVSNSYLTNSTNGISVLAGTATSFGPSNTVQGGGAFTGTATPFK